MTTHYKQFTTLQLADSTNKKSDNSAVYAVSFNLLDPKYYSLLAVVINNRVAIFAVDDSGAKYLDVFVDEPNENYYTCCWAENERGEPLVLAGGQKGLIRVINLATKQVERTLVGHGDAINDLVVHPSNRELVVSASRDESARLWDVVRGRCVAIFAGAGGHTEQVLTADIHASGERLITGGVDNMLKIWSLNTAPIQQAIKASREYDVSSSVPFKSVMAHFPEYSSNKVHSDYVDCAKWWGDLVLSKAPHEQQITCWTRPDQSVLAAEDAMVPLVALMYHTGAVWYIKFALDDTQQMCAAGNDRGEIHVWALHEWLHQKREVRETSERVDHLSGAQLTLPLGDKRRTIRAVCFSHHARYLAAGVEGGVVCLYRRLK